MAGLGHRQEKIVVRVRRHIERRQMIDEGCQAAEVIDEASGLCLVDAETDTFPARDPANFFNRARQGAGNTILYM